MILFRNCIKKSYQEFYSKKKSFSKNLLQLSKRNNEVQPRADLSLSLQFIFG